MRIVLVYFLLPLSLITCSDLGTNMSNDVFPIPKNRSVAEAQHLVVGHWEWVQTIAVGTTPWGNGLRTHIEFTASGETHFYRSDTLVSSAVFFIFLGADSTSIILGIGDYVPCPFRVNEQYFVTDYRRDSGPLDLYRKRN